MTLHKHLPVRRFFSLVAASALALVMSVSLAACADETEMRDDLGEDPVLLDTPAFDTTMYDAEDPDTLFGESPDMDDM